MTLLALTAPKIDGGCHDVTILRNDFSAKSLFFPTVPFQTSPNALVSGWVWIDPES